MLCASSMARRYCTNTRKIRAVLSTVVFVQKKEKKNLQLLPLQQHLAPSEVERQLSVAYKIVIITIIFIHNDLHSTSSSSPDLI